MPAYVKTLARACAAAGCRRAATVEVFNTYNASLGCYCTRHGDAKVAELNRDVDYLNMRTRER